MWPKIPAGFVKAVLAGHSALGLFFAALLYIVCLTGTLVVFHQETATWEQPGAPTGEPSDQAMATALQLMAQQAPVAEGDELHSVSLFANRQQPGRVTAHYFTDLGESGARIVDVETGALLEREDVPYAEFLENLHIYLRMPAPWGIYLVGLIGVAMLSLVVSGLLSHPRIFRDAFQFRRGGSRRLQEADLHNRLSVWALPFHIVVSFTGAFLGLSFFVVGILAFVAYDGDQDAAIAAVLGPQATENHDPAALPDMNALFDDARARTGLEAINYVIVDHVGTQGQVVTVDVRAPDDLASGEVLYYGADGSFLEASGSADGALGAQTFAAMAPLHFGSFGGYGVKFAYLVFGFASTLVTATGVSIWMARRREQGRPAPTWERIWIASVWGGAIGCFVPALTIPFNEGSATLSFLASILGAVGVSFAVNEAARLAGYLRMVLGAVLIAVVADNLIRNGSAASVGVPLAVNAALLVAGLAALSSPLWYMRRGGGVAEQNAALEPAE